jgi:hypothetical protein
MFCLSCVESGAAEPVPLAIYPMNDGPFVRGAGQIAVGRVLPPQLQDKRSVVPIEPPTGTSGSPETSSPRRR